MSNNAPKTSKESKESLEKVSHEESKSIKDYDQAKKAKKGSKAQSKTRTGYCLLSERQDSKQIELDLQNQSSSPCIKKKPKVSQKQILTKKIKKDPIFEKRKKSRSENFQSDNQIYSEGQEISSGSSALEGPNFRKVFVGDKVRIDFKNGDYYFGQVKNNLYHGRGYCSSKEFGIYDGQWVEGKRHGFGQYTDPDKNKYEGEFKNDFRHGKGKQKYQNGEKYEGQYQQDLRCGYGIYYFSNGDYYEGKWRQDMCNGKGKQVLADGTVYEGFWVDDQRDGEGIEKRKSGIFKQSYTNGQLIKQEQIKD